MKAKVKKMKKYAVLLMVFLVLVMIPMTAYAAMVRLYKIQVSAVDNHGKLNNPLSINGQTYKADTIIELMDAKPVPYSGFYFKGWHILNDPSILINTKIQVTKNQEYRAEFSPIGYHVSFDIQDGTAPLSELKSFGDEISQPTPTRDSYEFGGWYTDALCTGEEVVFPYTIKGNVTFYAKWESANQYDVRFLDENGEQIGETQKVAHGKRATAPDDLAKEGHTFAGWSNGTESPLSGAQIQSLEVTSSVEYTAKFNANVYDVRFFDENRAQIGETQQVEHGKPATAPGDLTKEGHTFAGWCNGTDAPISDTQIESLEVTSSVEYTAKFNANVYDVRFFDENSAQIGETQKVAHGQHATAPDDLAKEGHTFTGWSNGIDAPLSGAQIESLDVTSSIEYTATFNAKVYDVSFFDDEGSQIGETQKVAHGQHATAPDDLTKEGYTFAGWSNGTESSLSGAQIEDQQVTGSVVYTAKFNANVYDVSFYDEEGLKIGETQHVEHGKHATAPDDLTKEGHTFVGWSNGTQTLSKTQIDDKEIIEAADYTAMFEINSYKVSFQAYDVVENKSVEFNQLILEPAEPTRDGHDFAGWFIGEGSRWCFETDIMPAEDITLYAKWDIHKYTVVFYEQDGNTPIGLPQTVNWGSVAVPETAPVIIGYAFDGWVLSGSDTSEADSLTNIKENISAVASYIKDGFTVTFVDDQGQVIGTDGVCAGGSATPPNVPNKEGHTFTGWNVSLDSITDNITVTAQYAINTYTVRFVDENGSELSVQTVNWNASATAPVLPGRDGYMFTGWDIPFDKVTSDLTVRAQYSHMPTADNNADTHEINSISTDKSDDTKVHKIKLQGALEAGEMVTMKSEAIPAASNNVEVQSRYGEPISVANRTSLLQDHPETIIIVLGILTVLVLGLSVWTLRVKKRH